MTTKFISPEEFLSRTKIEPNISPRLRRIPANAPTIDRLFAAHLDRKSDVANLIEKMLYKGVAILFEDNATQPNYAPTIRLVGSRDALLGALITMTNDYHPDEVKFHELSAGPTHMTPVLDLWWD